MKNSKFARFYLLPKIHKDCMMFQVVVLFQTVVIIPKTYLLLYLDFHLGPLILELKSYPK